MAVFLQSADPSAAAFDSTDRYSNRIVVPYAHRLKSVFVTVQKTVTTGTVTVTLKKVDPGDGRGGAIVGTALNNADLGDVTDISTKLEIVLGDDDRELAPKNRQYFVISTGTDSADRFDEPVLLLELDQA